MMQKLGQGSFGTVYLVKNHVNILKNQKLKKKMKVQFSEEQNDLLLPEYFAMKVVLKSRTKVNINHLNNLMNEKQILLNVSHPFIIGVHYVFESGKRFYFIMDFMRCGDLFRQLQSKKYFKESISKFYAA